MFCSHSVISPVNKALSLSLSIYLSIYLSICLSVCLPIYLSLSLSLSVSLFSLSLSLSLSPSPSLSLPPSLPLSLSLSLSLLLSTSLSVLVAYCTFTSCLLTARPSHHSQHSCSTFMFMWNLSEPWVKSNWSLKQIFHVFIIFIFFHSNARKYRHSWLVRILSSCLLIHLFQS